MCFVSSFSWLNTMSKLFRKKMEKNKGKEIISVWWMLKCSWIHSRSSAHIMVCQQSELEAVQVLFVWLGAFWADNMLSSFEDY